MISNNKCFLEWFCEFGFPKMIFHYLSHKSCCIYFLNFQPVQFLQVLFDFWLRHLFIYFEYECVGFYFLCWAWPMQDHALLEKFILRVGLGEVVVFRSVKSKRFERVLSHELGILQQLLGIFGYVRHLI